MSRQEQTLVFAAGRRPYQAKERPSVSQWADENRYLSSKSSAFAGRWQTAKAPYQRAPMDCFSDPAVREIVLMWASQLGKSDITVNMMGWMAVHRPGPCLFLQPTDELARDFKRRRFDPARDECDAVSALIPSKRKKDGENSEDHVGFPGGSIDFRGVQTTGKVKSVPIRYLFADELDDFPAEAGTERNRQGDPLQLAVVRTSGYPHNKKITLTSTPTNESASRIWKRFENSSQEFFFIPCPGCHHGQVMRWENLNLETAEYACEACCHGFRQGRWYAMQRHGEWRANNTEHTRTRGFQLGGLYSPFVAWEELIEEKLEADRLAAMGDETQLKTFVNSRLCELWHDRGGDLVKHNELWDKRIVYQSTTPDEVLLITAAIDCQSGAKRTGQGAKLKYSIYGWAAERTGYLLEAGVIWRGSDEDAAWEEVDQLLYTRTFPKSDGTVLDVTTLFIDSGDLPDFVYSYCRGKQPKVFPIKGLGGEQPIIKPGRTTKTALMILGVDTIKDHLQSKLRLDPGIPGSINFPRSEDGSAAAGADREFFKEITSEHKASRLRNGRRVFSWEKPSGVANDYADCLVYNFGALEAAGGNATLKKLAAVGDKKPAVHQRMGAIQGHMADRHPDAEQMPIVQPQAAPQQAAANPLQPWASKKVTIRRSGKFQMPGM